MVALPVTSRGWGGAGFGSLGRGGTEQREEEEETCFHGMRGLVGGGVTGMIWGAARGDGWWVAVVAGVVTSSLRWHTSGRGSRARHR
jgi:hypothetical protein